MADDLTTIEARRYDIRDDEDRIVASVYARNRDEAIDIFCLPALRREAYFVHGGWTCERTFP